MAPANIVVPSDITLVENKMRVGRRRLGPLEWTGLMLTPPMLHIHYSKLDRGDMRAILTKKYDPEDTSPMKQLVESRQDSLSKHVVSTNFMWAGGAGFAGAVMWSFRRYNYQSRLLAMPFFFYFGTFAGRMVGDMCSFRNAEFARDRFLGSLPAKVYMTATEA